MKKQKNRKPVKRLFALLAATAVGFVGVTLYGARIAAKQAEAEERR